MELAYAAQDRGENVDIDKPFTPHQKSIVNARAAKAYHVAVIENDFRDFARSGGLTQTLLAPLLFIVGGICLFHKGRGTKLLGGSYMAVACAVGAIMMYRGYLFGFV